MAANTGLRASELASLTAESFDLDADSPTVLVEAAYSKHRRRDVLPLRADLVDRLRPFLSELPAKPPGAAQNRRERDDDSEADRASDVSSDGRLWPGTWPERAAAMMRMDLDTARVKWIKQGQNEPERAEREKSAFLVYEDEAGRVFDFHALRHLFISNLARGGAHPKEAQALARHSTINLTMDRYTHLGIVDLSAALDRLPELPNASGIEPEAATMRATGTDGQPADCVALPVALDVAVPTVPPSHELSDRGPQVGTQPQNRTPVLAGVYGPSCPELSDGGLNSGAGIRTPDTRIMIPLL